MPTMEATYHINVPMFLGDAHGEATGIRPPSVKGALHFWWRALYWKDCLEATDNPVAALRELHRREADLFGTAAGQNRGGQSRVLLQVVDERLAGRRDSNWPGPQNGGSRYLGLGLFPMKGFSGRQAIPEGGTFTLRLTFRRGSDDDTLEQIRRTLGTWSLFGGLGSRARRGFGSVTLLSLDGQDQRLSADGYRQAMTDRLAEFTPVTQRPPLTAFSGESRFRLLSQGSDARWIHDQAGIAYKNHRGPTSPLRGWDKVGFGLPLPPVMDRRLDKEDRRASPLIFHVHQTRDDQYIACALFLPATFHHDRKFDTVSYDAVESFVSSGEITP